MIKIRLLLPVALAVLGTGAAPVAAAAPPADSVQLRVDQAGYFPAQDKFAVLMSPTALANPAVYVVDGSGSRVARALIHERAAWSSAYPHVYGLDFRSFTRPGTYRLALAGTSVRSPQFPIEAPDALWSRVLHYGVRFDELQRDGANVVPSVLHRKPSHLNDRTAYVYAKPDFLPGEDVITDADLTRLAGGPVDVAGGWFDAGDHLKFTHSTAYADVLLFTAARDLGSAAPTSVLAEARHGLGWLTKMWDEQHQELYIQVGIGSGNEAGTFRGDHDGWRLPQADDHDTAPVDRYVSHRPVFEAAPPGARISPNLVGRVSAAFALAAQVDAVSDPARARTELHEATSLYARAATSRPPKPLVTALPHAFYPESTWHDDMELGAVEIARAMQDLHASGASAYLHDAGRWAAAYLQHDTGDTFNLYDTSALAHTDLLRTVGSASLAVSRTQLLVDLRRQLGAAASRSMRDPFAAGVVDTEFDVDSHTLGLVATEGWYADVSGDHRFDALAARLRGWVFGANAWGVSFMVGIGVHFPHCMQHQVANLVGSTDGSPPLALGAVVNGPNGADLFADGLGGYQDGMVHCPSAASPPAVARGRYDGSGSVYLDDVRSWQTDEPALDMTGAAIIAAAAQLAG
ncbi:MAG: endoglucanase [Pseudonocardiales bacterium]|nr:endoglucanase [Pseudonocardiales bacterium]